MQINQLDPDTSTWLNNYMFAHQQIITPPCALVTLGTSLPERPASHALNLYKKKPCLIVLSGGWNSLIGQIEAEVMADILRRSGVREEDILLEKQAQHTLANFAFSTALIQPHLSSYKQCPVAIVAISYHMKRALLSAQKIAPDIQWVAADYPSIHCVKNQWQESAKGCQLIVSELKKIKAYLPEASHDWPSQIHELCTQ